MDDALTLDGRVAIVTGAGNGLGRAESLALARAGARLVLNDLPGDAVQAVAARDRGRGRAGGRGRRRRRGVGDGRAAAGARRSAQYGRLDILVNNAGVLRDRMIFTMSDAGMGPGHPGAPARALRDHAACHRALAGAAERGRAARSTRGS